MSRSNNTNRRESKSSAASPGASATGEYVWDELDILMDDRGAPIGSGAALHGAWAAADAEAYALPPGMPGGADMGMMHPRGAASALNGHAMMSLEPPLPPGVVDPNLASSSNSNLPAFLGPTVKQPRGRGTKASRAAAAAAAASSMHNSNNNSYPGTSVTSGVGGKHARSDSGDSGDGGNGSDREAKRRAAVAAASRATRAKRKRELEDLKEKNVRLERERETFLNTIADLQMKVQALRETGSIDLRMENDLLRAELMEHKSFISKFKRIADGMPTSTSAKKLMCKQGSDTAIAQVLGLMSTSMADPSWRLGRIRDHPEIELRYQRLPHGAMAGTAKRCSVRVDVPVVPTADPLDIARVIWSTWCDEEVNSRISKHFGAHSVSVREIETGVDDSIQDATAGDVVAGDGLRNCVKVYYYREESPAGAQDAAEAAALGAPPPTPPPAATPPDVVDTVLLLSSREKTISRSSFPQDARFHKFPPDAAQEQQYVQGKRKPAQAFTLEQQQGLEGQNSYPAIVLASTSTQHSLGLVPVKPGVHRIRSALLEGSVLRKVEGGVAWSSVFSYPSAAEGKKVKSNHQPLITDEGELNELWTKVVCEIHDIVRERLSPGLLDEYRRARDMGVPLAKEITDYL